MTLGEAVTQETRDLGREVTGCLTCLPARAGGHRCSRGVPGAKSTEVREHSEPPWYPCTAGFVERVAPARLSLPRMPTDRAAFRSIQSVCPDLRLFRVSQSALALDEKFFEKPLSVPSVSSSHFES